MKIAAIQMASSRDVDENMDQAQQLVKSAVREGAQLVVFPEFWPYMPWDQLDDTPITESTDDVELPPGPIQTFMSSLAHQEGIWLFGGTLPLRNHHYSSSAVKETVGGGGGQGGGRERERVFNSMLVYNPKGQRVARYDKIHLSKDSSCDEAEECEPGKVDATVAVEVPDIGRVGLSICHDLRFPELYRSLGSCKLVVVSAAFSVEAGAHWELLLRARAVDNQCYIIAADQAGPGRFGHSMIVDPYGDVLAEVVDPGPGYVCVEVGCENLEKICARMPILEHRIS